MQGMFIQTIPQWTALLQTVPEEEPIIILMYRKAMLIMPLTVLISLEK